MLVDQPAQRENTRGTLRVGVITNRDVLLAIVPALVGIFAFLARIINVGQSYDIFIDELTYLKLAQSIAFNHSLTLAGRPFFLHPPEWLMIEAVFIRLFHVSGSLFVQVYATRYLVAAFAALSATLVFLIARRAAGWPAALIAAAFFSLDPFIIRFNSMNMLEASAVFWVLAGYWALSGLSTDERPAQLAVHRQVLAGIFFGHALLTKEMTAFLTLLPLAIIFVAGSVLPRRTVVLISACAAIIYATYPVAALIAGQSDAFIQQKTSGLVRFTGLIRTTGFHRPGGPSLVQTVFARLDLYGTTYLIMGLGLVAICLLLMQRSALLRLLAIYAGCTYVMLAYSMLLGTLEEQFFYYLVVAATLACAVAVVVFFNSGILTRGQRPALRMMLILLALITIYDESRWANAHLIPNNGFEHVEQYLRAHVPGGERVASTSEVGQAVLQGYLSGPWGVWSTVEALNAFQPDYVLVTPHDLAWNNSGTAPLLLAWIEQNGTAVYAFNGAGDNQLILYALPTDCRQHTEPDEDDANGPPYDTDGCP